MRSKKASLHPFLILLAVAMTSLLFVVACGSGGEATTVAQAPAVSDEAEVAQVPEAVEDTTAAEAAAAAAAEAAAAEAEVTEGFTALLEVEEESIEFSEEAAAEVAEVPDAGGPIRGGSLKVGFFPNFVSLDPHAAAYQGEVGVAILQATYDNLLMIQPDLTIKPELATSWETNADLSSYTFHLRKGVKFHHGKEFTAEDVVFSINRMVDPVVDPPTRTTFSVIEEMVVIDDYTVRFDLVAPNGLFPTYLSIYQARIMPSDVDIDRLYLEEFGTGPFKLEEHLPNERATMVRYDDYWDADNIYLDEIVIVSIPEVAARDLALQNGDIDVL